MPRAPRTTRAQRQQWVQLFFNSGLSHAAFAQQHGLKLARLYRWLSEAKRSTPAVTKPVVFQEVKFPPVVHSPGHSWAMEILTPAGLIVRLR